MDPCDPPVSGRRRHSSGERRTLRTLSASKENTPPPGPINKLPYELLEEIFKRVKDAPILANCAEVCRLWHSLVWSRLSQLDVSPFQGGRRALIPIDNRRLLLLVTHCPRLTKLNLTRCLDISDEGVAYLTNLPSLRQLSLRECKKVTDAGTVHLAKLTLLEELDLSDVMDLTDKGLECLTHLTRLIRLYLHFLERITNVSTGYLKCLTRLNTLDLSYCKAITDEGLKNLQGLTQLTHLDLSGDNRIQKEGWQHLSNLTNIRKLGLEGTIINSNVLHFYLLRFLTRLTCLEDLRFGFCEPLSDDFCQIFSQQLSTVTRLSINNCTGLSQEAFRHFQQLVEFEFTRSQIPPSAFRGMTKLRKLNVEKSILKKGADGKEHTLKHLATMKSLKNVNISLMELTDAHLEYLSKCRSIKKLNLLWLQNVTSKGLLSLTKLKSLKWLNLTSCEPMTDDVLHHLCLSCRQLEALSLASCLQLTDAGIQSISYLTNLRYLVLFHVEKITDKGVLTLTSLSNLQLLELTGCKKVSLKTIQNEFYKWQWILYAYVYSLLMI
jgi:F-box/leucine-rich repeat protein 14